jgi:ferritin-like metal-binding protein YciE
MATRTPSGVRLCATRSTGRFPRATSRERQDEAWVRGTGRPWHGRHLEETKAKGNDMAPIATMAMHSLKDLLVEQLNELYAAETHSHAVLTKLAFAASSPKLVEALRSHADETKQHTARLERVFGEIGGKPRKLETHGCRGLLEDCTELAGRTKIDPGVRDAALIAVVQRLEHDELAGYGCARTWAGLLGHTAAASELLKTLTEERRFDENLSKIAESLNKLALEPVGSAR